jgi:hypothetical protein
MPVCTDTWHPEGEVLWRKRAREYYRLKKELSARLGSDRDAHTDAKTSFIEAVVAEAREAQRGQ